MQLIRQTNLKPEIFEKFFKVGGIDTLAVDYCSTVLL
jgi:hypothetical protein